MRTVMCPGDSGGRGRGRSRRRWLLALGSALAVAALAWLGPAGSGQEKAQPERGRQDDEFVEKFIKKSTESILIGQSKPVTVNGARFVLSAQTNWRPPRPERDWTMAEPVQLQLRLTNLGKSDLIFPMYRTFGVRVLSADGKEVKARKEVSGTNSTPPILLSRGGSFSLCRRAEIQWDEKAKASELHYYDGTGAHSVTGPLKPGRYKLVFWYSAPPDKNKPRKDGDPPTWAGEAVTGEVPIQVLEGTAHGLAVGKEYGFKQSNESIRIRESKPVTKNGAEFVAASQAGWKVPKRGEVTPIEMQLRITNLSKNYLFFPTINSLFLRIFNSDGEKIMWQCGNDVLRIPRPLCLPPGASYAFVPEGLPHALDREAGLGGVDVGLAS